MKYLKYYISTLTLFVAINICFLGENYPTIFFIGFSLFIISGDIIMKKDHAEQEYSKPYLLNIPIYLNFFLLSIIVFSSVFIISDAMPGIFVSGISNYFNVDLLEARSSINYVDSIFLVALTGLFIGIMGTVPGHELAHRKKNKFDMFMGNWLLALSWDCAFAVEHVHGHHKNVGLKIDPATAKRGENIYKFIFKATIKEQMDAWKIEMNYSKKHNRSIWSIKNRIMIGYLRSIVITSIAFLIGGLKGMAIYILCAFIAKALLEVINFSEHYGLIRIQGEPVRPHHSWNSNSALSSIYLYNVTRHSSHHEKANLKYWELHPYQNSPMMPQGYLTMLYMALFVPFLFRKMMAKKLIDWDRRFATSEEKLLAREQNMNSGIPALVQSVSD